MQNKLSYGEQSSVTATHATAAVASKAGVTGVTHYAINVAVSSDKAGSILLIKDGTTVIWQQQVGATFCNLTFPAGLKATKGNLLSAEIDGTSACKANLCLISI